MGVNQVIVMKLFALLFPFALLCHAQEAPAPPLKNPVKWSAQAPKQASPGQRIQVKLVARVDEDWHMYSLRPIEGGPIATSIDVPAPQYFKLIGVVDAPVPLTAHEESFGMAVEFYFGEVEFFLPVEVNRDAKTGSATLTVTAKYQACDNTICLPPKTVKLESKVEIK